MWGGRDTLNKSGYFLNKYAETRSGYLVTEQGWVRNKHVRGHLKADEEGRGEMKRKIQERRKTR